MGISQSVFNKGGPRDYFCSLVLHNILQNRVTTDNKMDDKIVGTVMVESSQISAFTALADELGVTITFEKPIKFEDLGLAELEKGQFQCLMCSKLINRKARAVEHFKKFHTEIKEPMERCPRCDAEITKSKFQMHMEKSHEINANFKLMMKRSFQPNLSENETIKEKIPKMEQDVPKKEMNSKSPSKKAEKDVAEKTAIQNAKKDAAKQEKVGGTKKAATKKEKIPKPKKKAAKKTETGVVKELKISLQKLTEEEINNNTKEDKVVESAVTESNETDTIKQE